MSGFNSLVAVVSRNRLHAVFSQLGSCSSVSLFFIILVVILASWGNSCTLMSNFSGVGHMHGRGSRKGVIKLLE